MMKETTAKSIYEKSATIREKFLEIEKKIS